jgi:dynein heavy chain
MCISLTPDCTKDQLLQLWHHECDWLFGQRMIDNVDIERYQLAYKTVVKKNFSDLGELALLNRNLYFSNLKESESGIVMAGVNINTNYSSSNQQAAANDGYEPRNDLHEIRHLIQMALNEYNKEQQHIAIPLYDTTLNLITRLCHSTQCVGGNCCIVADGGISPFIIQLVASLMQFNLIYFKASQFMHSRDQFFAQLKAKLIASYYKAGIRVNTYL